MALDDKFFFHWSNPTDTAWSSAFETYDEYVLSFVIEHTEGNLPTMEIVVRNPHVGFLNSGRLYWAWLSWNSISLGVTPLFFGRLIGIPTDLEGETVTMRFIARPTDFIQQKQNVAETLKVPPQYDRIWYSFAKQDDPDTILEGLSSVYHIDRTTLAVSVSDVLQGEDGTVVFTGVGDAMYKSLKIKLGQPPLRAVAVQAHVTWDQQYQGFFDVVSGALSTYTGESFVNDWPKTGSGIGGGYSASVAWAGSVDGLLQLASTLGNFSSTYSWQNERKNKQNGDVESISMSYSHPALNVPGISATIWSYNVIGILDPAAVDANGDPAPINIPAHNEFTSMLAAEWNAGYALSLNYRANRKRSEYCFFTLEADTQAIITDPLVTENTETMTLSSSSLSMPELILLNWSSVAGQPVSLGTMVFPDNPLQPGQTSTQICVTAGTAGLIEPLFSNIAGQTTNDGTVVWSSLGSTPPLETGSDWTRQINVSLGTLLIPLPLVAPDINSLLIPGLLQFPPTGVWLNQFQIVTVGESIPGGTMLECTSPGMYGSPAGSLVPAIVQPFTNPTGMNLYVCTVAGQTSQYHPTFNETKAATTVDGTATWTCIGPVTLPVGGWPGMTPQRSYFPSDRGKTSIEHLICRALAKLRKRARAVQVSHEIPFAMATQLSCRKNATLHAPQLPGEVATGKVIGYKLIASGNQLRVYGEVTIGCSIGYGGTPTLSTGTGTITGPTGVFLPGTQYMSGAVVDVTGRTDVAYTPPVEATNDDGLVFPLGAGGGQALLTSTFHGSQAEELIIVQQAFTEAAFQARNGRPATVNVVGSSTTSVSYTEPDIPAVLAAMQQAYAQGSGLWFELSLKPLTNGPFADAYQITVSPAYLPMTIDLTAGSYP